MTRDLAPEDSFRLHVLLAQELQAVRIDEPSLTLHALTEQGEASIPLNPHCRADQYLRQVRALLSDHALGSPDGYPVFLMRWMRHDQMEGSKLGKLLLTGEPEAVVAVVHSPGLTDELARYAWWVQPTIENARLMLRREAVAQGGMGRMLADFLIEHLPFLHDDHLAIIHTVGVLIDSQAVTAAGMETLWKWGRRSNTYFVAFLERAAADFPLLLPLPLAAHAQHSAAEIALKQDPSGVGKALVGALSSQGQTFLDAAGEVLERPETQEVVSHTLNAIGRYFSAHIDRNKMDQAHGKHGQPFTAELQAVSRLAQCDDTAVRRIFTRSTAIGSLMRRKIEPVITPLLHDIAALRR